MDDPTVTSIKNYIDISNARIEGRLDLIANDVSYTKAHNEKQNGWIESHAKKLEENAKKIVDLEKTDISIENYQEHCPANIAVARLFKWKTLGVVVTIVVIAYFVLETVYQAIGFERLIERLSNIL